jgi:hypothetical protein
MQTTSAIDMAITEQASRRRERALAAIAKYKTSSGVVLFPPWFALLMALLIAFMPVSRPNPIPFVAAMLAFAIVCVTVTIVRGNRRLEAIVELIVQDAQNQ